MEVPFFVDSDDADSIAVSEKTMIMTDEPYEPRTCADLNPDEIDIDVDLYLDDLYMSREESEIVEEPKVPKSVPRSKATTVEELEDELVECVSEHGSVFHILYLLHEHFSKSKTVTSNQKAVAKGRILGKLRGKVSEEKIKDIVPILNNFFN